MNTSTPIKRIRFRGDSFQGEIEPLLDNEHSDEIYNTKNGENSIENGLFTYFYLLNFLKTRKNDTQSNNLFVKYICRFAE